MKANCALALRGSARVRDDECAAKITGYYSADVRRRERQSSGRSLVEEEAKNARAVLVLEPPASGGRVKTARKGTGIFAMKSTGARPMLARSRKRRERSLELARQTIRLTNLNDRR